MTLFKPVFNCLTPIGIKRSKTQADEGLHSLAFRWDRPCTAECCARLTVLRARGFHNLHLDALAELERGWLLESDAHRQDAGVGRAAGVFGTDPAGDEAVGDFLDGSLPGLAGVALGGDRDGTSWLEARDVEGIDLGLDTQSGEIDDAEQGRAQIDSLAGVRGA